MVLSTDIKARVATLKPHERAVMELLSRGYDTAEIARELGVKDGTVRIYVHRMLCHLRLRNRIQLALTGYQLQQEGSGPPGPGGEGQAETNDGR